MTRLKFTGEAKWYFLVIFIIVSVSLFVKFHAEKHLSLDGVNYFYHVLENQNFANIAWSRRFTEYLTEWPLVLAVRCGVTDIPTLIDIFAIGIYLPYLLSFALSWYAVRDENKALLWFPLAGYLGYNLLSDYDLIADHHVIAVMTWPIMLMILKSRPLIWLEGLILWLLLILYSRMYETAVLTGGMFFLMVLIRMYRFPEQREKVINGVSLVLLAVAISISIIYIIDPRSPQNRGSFLDAIWVNRRNWEAIATYGFISIFSLGWIVSERWTKTRNFLFFAALLPISWYMYSRFTTDYAMTAYISFSSRSLIGVFIPGLIVLAAIVAGMRRTLSGAGIASFSAAVLVMVGFNIADLRYWIDVKEEFLKVGNSETRYISIEDTPLRDSHYRWSWNNSLLSLVWSSPCVDTIVLNATGDPQGPFNPREHLVLKRYLKYDSYFATVDSDISVCDR